MPWSPPQVCDEEFPLCVTCRAFGYLVRDRVRRPNGTLGEIVYSITYCPACLGWPLCCTCPGPPRKRAHPDGDGRCTTCASA
ncbi:hypothetical protein ACWD3J_44615 [Streptomyces sp. NPDC002755]